MSTWEDPPDDDEAYAALCESSQPSDFYFAIIDDGYDDIVCIAPKAYYDKHNCMWDQYIPLDHILPDDFGDSDAGLILNVAGKTFTVDGAWVWAPDRHIDDTKRDLVSRGFEENDDILGYPGEKISGK